MDNLAGMTVEEIARTIPESLQVFQQYRIDLCCGGRLTLSEVARRHGIDLAKLIQDLEKIAHASR